MLANPTCVGERDVMNKDVETPEDQQTKVFKGLLAVSNRSRWCADAICEWLGEIDAVRSSEMSNGKGEITWK